VAAAAAWGAVAASSLLIGVASGLLRTWPGRVVGLVLAFGAGALISAVSFELAEEGVAVGGAVPVGIGLAAGALVYFVLARRLARAGKHTGRGGDQEDSGAALALGAFLDGIPEQLVLGIGIAAGEGVSVGLLVAIFVSNIPEAIGSATDMRESGSSTRSILLLWAAVAVVCALATPAGFLIADNVSDEFKAGVNGFAAGALLVMLVDSMIPEAAGRAGRPAGLATTLGFAVATALSTT
jgi:ZIP family zinc transporter